MTHHERVTFTQFAHLTSAQRPNAIRERFKAERAAYRIAPSDSSTESVAKRNIDDFKQWLASAESNERLRTVRIAALEAERERQKQQAADVQDRRLREQYDRALPKPTSDSQWVTAPERVLHRHALPQIDQQSADRAALRRRLRTII
jgi:hypothetical protein